MKTEEFVKAVLDFGKMRGVEFIPDDLANPFIETLKQSKAKKPRVVDPQKIKDRQEAWETFLIGHIVPGSIIKVSTASRNKFRIVESVHLSSEFVATRHLEKMTRGATVQPVAEIGSSRYCYGDYHTTHLIGKITGILIDGKLVTKATQEDINNA